MGLLSGISVPCLGEGAEDLLLLLGFVCSVDPDGTHFTYKGSVFDSPRLRLGKLSIETAMQSLRAQTRPC